MTDYSGQRLEPEEDQEPAIAVGEGVETDEEITTAEEETADAKKLAEDAADAARMLRVSTKRIELPEATADDAPDWVKIPGGMKFPKGKQVIFMRFRASMTDTPWKGERQAIIWSCNLGDQKLAIDRSDKDPNRMSEQLTKQMVRAVDGERADWTGRPGAANIDQWWDEIGPKCRNILDKLFAQLHIANQAEAIDFFENCVAVRSVTG